MAEWTISGNGEQGFSKNYYYDYTGTPNRKGIEDQSIERGIKTGRPYDSTIDQDQVLIYRQKEIEGRNK